MSDAHYRLTAALADRYRVESELGKGGMATVYLAHDLRHDRKVAVKFLHPELAAVLGVDRFLAEIRTTAGLQHPGILPLFDSGEAAGQVFYVMPYVEGESLRARLDREGQLPVADAMRIAAEVAEALAYAHEHGVVHRDIKPENILLQAGRPLVADFGIALAVQQAGGARLTQTGLSLGTPQYMSPEQAAAERTIDGRTDIYALGAVLYEMLAGTPPFTAPTTQAIIAKLMSEEARPIESLRKTVPGHLALAVRAALQKLPADRFSSAGEFAQAIRDPGAASPPAGITAASILARRRVPALAWLGAGAVVGAIAVWLAVPRPEPEPASPIRFIVGPDSAQSLALTCCGQMIALSPDGRILVFPSSELGLRDASLFVRDLSSVGNRLIEGTEGNPRGIFFSPDGASIGFVTHGALRKVALAGGSPETVTQVGGGFYGGGAWTDDGRIVYAVASLRIVPAAGGESQVLLAPDSARGETELSGPHFVPGARAVLFTKLKRRGDPEIGILWLEGGRTRTVTRGAAPSYVASGGGYLLTVRPSGELVAHRFDPLSGDTSGPAGRLAEGVRLRSPVLAFAEYSASANGTIVRTVGAVGTGTPQVRLVNMEGAGEVVMLPFRANHVDWPRFSPDGKRIAVAGFEEANRTHSVYAYDLEGKTATRLTFEESEIFDWAFDGRSILYVGDTALMLQPADRSGGPRVFAPLREWRAINALSVRGPWAVVEGTSGTLSNDIGMLHRDSARIVAYSAWPFQETGPALSPDGRWLAFAADETGRREVYMSSFPTPGERIIVSIDGGAAPRWSGDGRTLYYMASGRIVAATVRPGPPFAVLERRVLPVAAVEGAQQWDVDPSRPRLVLNVGVDAADRPLLIEVNALPAPPGPK